MYRKGGEKMERKYLKQLRTELNMTQQELASELGISAIYVRKIEKGVVKPGRNTLVMYEKFFNKSMKVMFPDIFFETDDTKFIKKIV